MSENGKNKSKNVNFVYAVIGVLTLMITVTGATFAYYTATQTVNNRITGNMATVNFGLTVTKKTNVDQTAGLIPMTNSMVEKAVSNASTKGICLDDNGNAVCQIYKIIAVNSGTSSMFVDGYVTLTGGSGSPTDYPTSPTTMRWAQVFCSESSNNLSSCTTAGTATARQTNTTGFTWTALGSNTSSQHDTAEIKTAYTGTNGVTGSATISNGSYNVIKTNYIRVSMNPAASGYVPANDVSSALVYSQFLQPNDNVSGNNDGSSSAPGSGTSYTDAQVYYIVVWLSETGTNQTAGSGGARVPSSATDFFQGRVTFVTANGREVTSQFNGYTRVTPDTQ